MSVFAVVLIALGSLVMVAPWLAALGRKLRNDHGGTSFVPFLGPALCAIGFAMLGTPAWLYFVPLALDAGTIGLARTAVTSLRSRSRSS